jgi:hypothetical protein
LQARGCGIRLKRQLEPRNFLLPNLFPGAAHCRCGKIDTQRWREQTKAAAVDVFLPSFACLTISSIILARAHSVPTVDLFFLNSNFNFFTCKLNLIDLYSKLN